MAERIGVGVALAHAGASQRQAKEQGVSIRQRHSRVSRAGIIPFGGTLLH